ncbi:hypothetical protein [Thalassotalea sp. G2M2-11]|uniref:hypothetical protein n=1 Tax=Thalassotalea sp. G2M2-11 TaxID=2787627 RepID=UPI0019D0F28E|nr:hypothetical protein [Thalassotalea sp. G2M2-11]
MNIDFENAECTACNNKSIDIRTEVLLPTEKSHQKGRIRKMYIFTCPKHLGTDTEQMLILAKVKAKKAASK